MCLTISEDVLKETDKCEHGFSCLKSLKCEDKAMCPVDYANGTNVLFLLSNESIPCPYNVPFGYGTVCACPTHFAIYNKYGQ